MSRSTRVGLLVGAVSLLAIFGLSVFAAPGLFATAATAANTSSPTSGSSSTDDPAATTFVANLMPVAGAMTSATGQAVFQLSPNGTSLTYLLSVHDLNDTFMAHIHIYPSTIILAWLYPNPNGVIAGQEGNCALVMLGGPANLCSYLKPGLFDGVLASGTITAADLTGLAKCFGCANDTFSQLVAALDSGSSYVNVHTLQYPIGAIEGTIEPVSSVNSTSSSPQLTVNAIDQNGNPLSGYSIALNGQSGTTTPTAYSPAMFNLTAGQAYNVTASNYGSCTFASWSDGSVANPREVQTSYSLALTAVYNCAPGSSATATSSASPASSSLNVVSVDQNGNPLPGYYVALAEGTTTAGFTPASFSSLTSGTMYSLMPGNYAGCIFTQWSDGSVANPRAFLANGSNLQFTAVYDCVPHGTSIVNVSTTTLQGGALSGYHITLMQAGAQVDSCFSSCSFTVNDGQGYQIGVFDYANETFSQWKDGTMTQYYPLIAPSEPTTISLVALYSTTTTTSSSSSSSSATPTTSTSSTSGALTSTTSTTTSSTAPSTTSTTSTTASTTSTTVSSSSGASTATVIIPQGAGTGLNFDPSTITVSAGTTVTFSDQDSIAPHNVWFLSIPSGATNPNTAAGQSSGYAILNGQSVSYTLTTPGTYTYECQFHAAWMQGTIVVTG